MKTVCLAKYFVFLIILFYGFSGAATFVQGEVASKSLQEEFWDACEAGNRVALERLLRQDPSLVNIPDVYGDMPLRAAIVWELPEVIKLFLKYDVDINFLNERIGMTPLHTAILIKHEEIVRLLLEDPRIDIHKKVMLRHVTIDTWDYLRECSSVEIVSLFDRFKK